MLYAQINKLRISHVFLGATFIMRSRWKPYLISALVPLILIAAFNISESFIPQSLPVTLLYSIFSYFIVASVAFTYHRITLLGPKSTSMKSQFQIDKARVVFVGNLFLIALMTVMPLLLGATFANLVLDRPAPLWLLLGPVGFYLSARLSVTLPARAVGRPLSLSQAWALTSGNGLKIMLLLYVLPYAAQFLIARQEIWSTLSYAALVLVGVTCFLLPFIVVSLIYAELFNFKVESV